MTVRLQLKFLNETIRCIGLKESFYRSLTTFNTFVFLMEREREKVTENPCLCCAAATDNTFLFYTHLHHQQGIKLVNSSTLFDDFEWVKYDRHTTTMS